MDSEARCSWSATFASCRCPLCSVPMPSPTPSRPDGFQRFPSQPNPHHCPRFMQLFPVDKDLRSLPATWMPRPLIDLPGCRGEAPHQSPLSPTGPLAFQGSILTSLLSILAMTIRSKEFEVFLHCVAQLCPIGNCKLATSSIFQIT